MTTHGKKPYGKTMASAISNAMPRYGTGRYETERNASKTQDHHLKFLTRRPMWITRNGVTS